MAKLLTIKGVARATHYSLNYTRNLAADGAFDMPVRRGHMYLYKSKAVEAWNRHDNHKIKRKGR